MTPNSSCPPASVLRQFFLGQLSPEEVEKWADHVEACAACIGVSKNSECPDDVIDTLRNSARAAAERDHPLVKTLIEKITQWPIPDADTTRADEEWMPLAAPSDRPGAFIAGYRLIEKIGEGGMGAVWVAEQEHPVKRQVAMKLIRPGMDTAQVIHRFEAERQALALMDHDNIAKVLDAGAVAPAGREDAATGRPYFVMELVRGQPITSYCDQHCLTIQERLQLFLPVCQAIQHAHHRGIIHRDIKPSNILVCLQEDKSVAKVIDFGIAKALHDKLTDDTMRTEFGMVIGTLEYMSPEQAEPKTHVIDTRSDIYSLGVLLYELLTGSTPIGRERLRSTTLAEVLRLIREEEPRPPSLFLTQAGATLTDLAVHRGVEPSRLPRLVRGELDWIVMKALEKDRHRRYESASALARDIECYLHGDPVEACPPSVSYRLRKFLKKNRGPVVAAGVIIALLVAGLIGASWGMVTALRARDAEATERRRATEAQQQARRERDEAAQQAAIARAVGDFLQKDLLGQADLANQALDEAGDPRDPDIKVRTLLERAGRSIDRKFAGQPLTEAAIRMTLGDVWMALGQFTQAQDQLERSLQLRERHRGPDHIETLASINSLSELYMHLGKFDEAAPLLARAVAGRSRKLGADHPDTLTSKHNLAALRYEQGKYAAAAELFKEVMAASTKRLGPDHADTLASKNGLALVYQHLGKLDQAESLLVEVMQSSIASLGADHPHTLRSKSNLALLYQARSRYDRAEPLLLEVLNARTAKLGAEHPQTLSSKENVALLWEAQGNYAAAEPLLQEVLRIRTTRLGADHPDTLRARQNFAVMRHAQGKSVEAAGLLEDILGVWSGKLGADHPETLTSKSILASVYRSLKKVDQAEALLRDVVQGRSARLGGHHHATISSQLDLANVLAAQKKFSDAEAVLMAAYEAAKNGNDPFSQPSDIHQSIVNRLAELYEAWNKPDEARLWRMKLVTAKRS